MTGIKVCMNCNERQVGCHANCEKYLLEKSEYTKLKEKITVQNELYSYARGSAAKHMDASAKKRKRQHGYSKL